MVFFTCNSCGQSVKKNQVEKHRLSCRKCQSLSCMDCGKDFWGEAYAQHTKCVTEEEKYSGKDYKEKASTLKRAKLQEQLSSHLQTVVADMKSDDKLTQLLKRLILSENIPHKHQKFQKYLENSFKVTDVKLINDAWKIFNDALVSCQSNEEKNSKESERNVKPLEDSSVMQVEENVSQESTEGKKKKHKKKRKSCNEEEMDSSKASYRLEEAVDEMNKTNIAMNDDDDKSETTNSHKKKKHKRSLSPENEETKSINEVNGNILQVKNDKDDSCKKPKKKKHHDDFQNGDITTVNDSAEHNQNLENVQAPKSNTSTEDLKEKFKWTKVIKEMLLETSEHKLRLRHLRKKVLKLYKAMHGPEVDTEHLKEKFEKKCQSKFKIENGFVVLDR